MDDSTPPPTPPPPRTDRPPETWQGMLEMLAERKERYQQHQAENPPPPPRWQQVLLFTTWNLRRLRYWSRRWLLPHIKKLWQHVRGWLLWQWRDLKRNRDKRLAVLGLTGGLLIPTLLIVLLVQIAPPPALVNSPVIDVDPSIPVPAPSLGTDIEMEDEAAATDAEPAPAAPAADNKLTSANFMFELFAQRDEKGQLRLLNKLAEHHINEWFPKGSPAVAFMRFFGEVMMRSGMSAEDATLAARKRCLSMPVNRVFTQRTVTCTYGHLPPEPRRPRESADNRVFWIIALSYNNQRQITDIKVHARTTLASPR